MTLVPGLLLTALLATPPQDPPAARNEAELPAVLPLPLGRRSGLEVSFNDQHEFTQVSWRPPGAAATVTPIGIPLAHPVQDLEAGVAPDGSLLVLLAGGVRQAESGVRQAESLDVYLVPAQAGAGERFYRYETRGGRRLPAAFGGGRGSWPLVDGAAVQLFAYERQGRIEFRALDPTGQLHLVRSFEATDRLTGFRAGVLLATHEVRVGFEGAPAGKSVATFRHPDAPRLEIDARGLDFGTVAVGRQGLRILRLRNTGRRPLQVEVQAPAPFVISGEPVSPSASLRIEVGAETTVGIGFRPELAGMANANLKLTSNTPAGEQLLALRGEGLAPAVPVPTRVTPPQPEATQPAEPSPPRPNQPSVPIGRLLPPQLLSRRIGLAVAGSVQVEGMVLAPLATQLRLRSSSGGEVTVAIGEGGVFQARLSARQQDMLSVAAGTDSGHWSDEEELGWVLPALFVSATAVEVFGPPEARGELCAVLTGNDGAITHVLGRWSLRLSPEGKAKLPRGPMQALPDQQYVAVLVQDGRRVRSNVAPARR